MSRSKKVACAFAVTVLLGAVVGVALWLGGGATTRDGWEASSWVSGSGAFLLLSAPLWAWALKRTAFEQGHWGWAARVRDVHAEQVGVHRSRAGVGAYVHRDRDAQLRPRIREAARAGGVVLVVGDSTSGKTRAAWEAVAGLVPGRWLFVPALGADLTSLPGLLAAKAAHRTVVWLDDVDKHLNTSTGLDHTLLQRLTSAGALVIVTARTHAYNTYRYTVTADLQTQEGAVVEAGRQLLRGLTPVRLERLWSKDELQRAATSGDTHLAAAARRQSAVTGHGVTEYLAAAPELVALWRQAEESVGTDGGHPRGHRIVAAAVDLARIGVEHAPAELLAAAHAHYPLSAHLRPEPFSEALSWATQVQYGTCGLLIPATTDAAHIRWRPFDYFVDTTDTSIPEGLWDTALAHTTEPAVLASIGFAANRAALWVTAETAWIRAAEDGDTFAMFCLGSLLNERGEPKEAEPWYRKAAERGDTYAMFLLGALLADRDQLDEAEAWYRASIKNGNSVGMYSLAVLLAQRGESDEAEAWYLSAVEDGYAGAKSSLGFLLMKQGRSDEAEAWYRSAVEDGNASAMFGLGSVCQDQGRSDEAECWYRASIKNGNSVGMYSLAVLLAQRGETDEAEAWYLSAVEEGNASAMFGLGTLYEAQGRLDEAEGWYLSAVEEGNAGAKSSLGFLLMKQGRSDEAEGWYLSAVEDGETFLAKPSLGFLLMKQGRSDEAEAWYLSAVEEGNASAMFSLGTLYEAQGRSDEAESWYRSAAESGNTNGMCRLATLLAERGETDEAHAWRRRATEIANHNEMKDWPDGRRADR